jgi:hypothetical protein
MPMESGAAHAGVKVSERSRSRRKASRTFPCTSGAAGRMRTLLSTPWSRSTGRAADTVAAADSGRTCMVPGGFGGESAPSGANDPIEKLAHSVNAPRSTMGAHATVHLERTRRGYAQRMLRAKRARSAAAGAGSAAAAAHRLRSAPRRAHRASSEHGESPAHSLHAARGASRIGRVDLPAGVEDPLTPEADVLVQRHRLSIVRQGWLRSPPQGRGFRFLGARFGELEGLPDARATRRARLLRARRPATTPRMADRTAAAPATTSTVGNRDV